MNYANAIQTVAASLLAAFKNLFATPGPTQSSGVDPAYPHMNAHQLEVFRGIRGAWANVPEPGFESPRGMVVIYEVDRHVLLRYTVEPSGFISTCDQFEAQAVDHADKERALDLADMRVQLASDPTMESLARAFQEYTAGK